MFTRAHTRRATSRLHDATTWLLICGATQAKLRTDALWPHAASASSGGRQWHITCVPTGGPGWSLSRALSERARARRCMAAAASHPREVCRRPRLRHRPSRKRRDSRHLRRSARVLLWWRRQRRSRWLPKLSVFLRRSPLWRRRPRLARAVLRLIDQRHSLYLQQRQSCSGPQ